MAILGKRITLKMKYERHGNRNNLTKIVMTQVSKIEQG
jgi:hypothetical protein